MGTYSDKLIVTRTSRNGRRIGFHAFDDKAEMQRVLFDLIDLDYSAEKSGGLSLDVVKGEASLDLHSRGRYIGYGGQWVWEYVTDQQQLQLWYRIRTEQERYSFPLWKVTAIHPDWIDLAINSPGVPPHAVVLWELILRTRNAKDGHAFATRREATYLQTHDLYQPGHSQHRYSVPSEDLSDVAQRKDGEQ